MKTKITILVLLFTLNIIGVKAQIIKGKTSIPIATKVKAKKPQKINGTLVAPNGKHYFFTDKRYFRYSKEHGLEKIANTKPNWSGIPDNIDAVFVNSKNKKAYFFKGSKYNRWDFKEGNDNPELAISRFWKGVPNNIDAVTNHPNGKIYFFKGDTYYRYDSKLKKVDKTALISKNWKGVPNNVAAALLHKNGKIFFFKDNKYYRYNIKSRKVDNVGKGTIGRNGWKGLDFNKKNFTKKIVNTTAKNTKLKITLTSMKILKVDGKYDFVDVLLQQTMRYKANGKNIPASAIEYHYNKFFHETEAKNYKLKKEGLTAIIYPVWKNFRSKSGTKHTINNYLTYALTSKEVADGNALMEIRTNLQGVFFLKNGNAEESNYLIAENSPINVKISEILKYLLNPNDIPSNYFNSDGYHYSGAEGSVMPFKIAKDRNALDGHIEHSNIGITIRTYFHFELVD